MEKLVDIGKQMGLEGESLQKFVFEQQAIERNERVAKWEHEKLLKEAELKIASLNSSQMPLPGQGATSAKYPKLSALMKVRTTWTHFCFVLRSML